MKFLQRKVHKIDVPGEDEDVYVREITLKEQQEISSMHTKAEKIKDTDAQTLAVAKCSAYLLALSLCNESGELYFTDADAGAEELLDTPAPMFALLTDNVLEANGMAAPKEEEDVKN